MADMTDYNYSSDEVDSETEQFLYSQLHHEQNPMFSPSNRISPDIQIIEEQNPVTQKDNSSNKCPSKSAFGFFRLDTNTNDKSKTDHKSSVVAKQTGRKRTLSSDDSESKYNIKKKQKANESNYSEEVTIIDEIIKPDLKKSSLNCLKRKRHSSESSSEVEFLEELRTDVSINIKNNSRFNNTEDDCEEFSVKSLQKSMSNSNWDISMEDKYAHLNRSNRRYYGMNNVRCHNCNERGHLSKVCKKKRKAPVCFLCGQQGHNAPRCSNVICNICMQNGHFPDYCRSNEPMYRQKCQHCFYFGHNSFHCPDLWRKYHATTEEGPAVEVNVAWNKNMSCYNCSSNNHYGYQCRLKRMDQFQFPTYPGIISYNRSPLNLTQYPGSFQQQKEVNGIKKKMINKTKKKKIKEYLDFPRTKAQAPNHMDKKSIVQQVLKKFRGKKNKVKKKKNKMQSVQQ